LVWLGRRHAFVHDDVFFSSHAVSIGIMYIGQALITVDSVSWAEVAVPADARTGSNFNAKQIIFSNVAAGAMDVARRIVSANASTELVIPAGTQAIWRCSDDPRGFSGFSATQTGSVVAYLKSSSGSFDVTVEFLG